MTATKQRCRCDVGWRCIEWPTCEDGLCDYCRDECQRPVEHDRSDEVPS